MGRGAAGGPPTTASERVQVHLSKLLFLCSAFYVWYLQTHKRRNGVSQRRRTHGWAHHDEEVSSALRKQPVISSMQQAESAAVLRPVDDLSLEEQSDVSDSVFFFFLIRLL